MLAAAAAVSGAAMALVVKQLIEVGDAIKRLQREHDAAVDLQERSRDAFLAHRSDAVRAMAWEAAGHAEAALGIVTATRWSTRAAVCLKQWCDPQSSRGRLRTLVGSLWYRAGSFALLSGDYYDAERLLNRARLHQTNARVPLPRADDADGTLVKLAQTRLLGGAARAALATYEALQRAYYLAPTATPVDGFVATRVGNNLAILLFAHGAEELAVNFMLSAVVTCDCVLRGDGTALTQNTAVVASGHAVDTGAMPTNHHGLATLENDLTTPEALEMIGHSIAAGAAHQGKHDGLAEDRLVLQQAITSRFNVLRMEATMGTRMPDVQRMVTTLLSLCNVVVFERDRSVNQLEAVAVLVWLTKGYCRLDRRWLAGQGRIRIATALSLAIAALCTARAGKTDEINKSLEKISADCARFLMDAVEASSASALPGARFAQAKFAIAMHMHSIQVGNSDVAAAAARLAIAVSHSGASPVTVDARDELFYVACGVGRGWVTAEEAEAARSGATAELTSVSGDHALLRPAVHTMVAAKPGTSATTSATTDTSRHWHTF